MTLDLSPLILPVEQVLIALVTALLGWLLTQTALFIQKKFKLTNLQVDSFVRDFLQTATEKALTYEFSKIPPLSSVAIPGQVSPTEGIILQTIIDKVALTLKTTAPDALAHFGISDPVPYVAPIATAMRRRSAVQ